MALIKTVPMDLITGWEGEGSPYYQEVDVKFTEDDGKGYVKIQGDDILLDIQSIERIKAELEIFQRQVDAGK